MEASEEGLQQVSAVLEAQGGLTKVNIAKAWKGGLKTPRRTATYDSHIFCPCSEALRPRSRQLQQRMGTQYRQETSCQVTG